ncbi:MAG: hypothetical protein ACTSRS_20760 [Candidatus Helarchaeota archaeon]
MHTWVLGVFSIGVIAPIAGVIGWVITAESTWFWIVFWFYAGMGSVCIIIDGINHLRSHRGLFEHSNGCLSLRILKGKEKGEDSSYS